MRILLALLLTATLIFAAEERKSNNDRDRLQGDWQLVSWKENGRDLAVDKPKLFREIDVHWTFDGDKLSQRGNFQGIERKESLPKDTFRLYPEKNLRWIDLCFANGRKTEVQRGIYAIDGKRLKVCFNPDGHSEDRPTEFAARRGSRFLLFEFKRADRAK